MNITPPALVLTNTLHVTPPTSAASDPGILNADALYGSGFDGAITLDGVATVSGFTTVSGGYWLNRNISATTVTISAGVNVWGAGYGLLCQSLVNSGRIGYWGNDGLSNNTAGSGCGTQFIGGSASGGSGLPSSGNAGGGNSSSLGGNGGAGGSSGVGSGGAGGTATPPNAAAGGVAFNEVLPTVLSGRVMGGSALVNGGAGGGGGVGDGAGNGPGGGAGGGVFLLYAREISGSGTISCKGGAGGSAVGTGRTGAGGGGGGALFIITSTQTIPNTVTVAGGDLGTGDGAANGTAGSPGTLAIWYTT